MTSRLGLRSCGCCRSCPPPTSQGPIFRVPASGGSPQQVTVLDSTSGETAHRFPQFLPDGEHFLYAALSRRSFSFFWRRIFTRVTISLM